jgi:protein SCO1/2
VTSRPWQFPSRLSVAVWLAVAVWPVAATASRQEALPGELDGVGVTEHRGARLPEELGLVDETGKAVRLGQYLHHGRPLILTLNYYSCPMLCTVQLNGLVATLKGLGWVPGRELEIVTVSINPLEGPALASAKKQTYLAELDEPGAVAGWHFLTGQEPAIRTLASRVGFGYRWVAAQGQYAHPTAIMLVTPDGVVSSYLYGVQIDPGTLRLALVEAGKGAIGTARDQILLFCFHYDPNQGRYVLAAMRLMQVAGAITVAALAVAFGLWRRGERRRLAATGRPTQAAGHGGDG